MRLFILILLSVLILPRGFAGSLQIGVPTYSGTGCPPGSVDSVLVPDLSAITVGFSDMTTQALAQQKAQLGCRLSIPLKIEKGVRAIIVESDFEGFLSLPSRATADFYAIYRLYQGRRVRGTEIVYETANGPFNGSYLVAEDHRDRLVSPCGGAFSLDLDINMRIQNRSRVEAASFTIDSTNLAAYQESMYFYVRTERCR